MERIITQAPITRKIQSQVDAAIYFIQNMNIEMLSDSLDDECKYQEIEKNLFLDKMSSAFENFKENGDTYLNKYSGYCNSSICDRYCTGFSFIGNNSNNYMNLIILIKDERVTDIYECTIFNNYGEDFLRKQRVFL